MSTSMREALEKLDDAARGFGWNSDQYRARWKEVQAALSSPEPDRLSEEERRAVENLRTHQEQCDMDGVMVKVSRQAVDETLAIIDRLSRQPEAEPDAYAEIIGGRVVSCRPDKSPHCTAPLYLTSPRLDREKVTALLDKIGSEARRYASHYKSSSDGRNTFILFAEWVEKLDADAIMRETL